MPIDAGLASLSNTLLFCTVVLYAVSMLGYAAEFAFGRRPRSGVVGSVLAAPVDVARVHERIEQPALVTAGRAPAVLDLPADAGRAARREAQRELARRESNQTRATGLGKIGVAGTVAGWVCHVGSVTTRGLSVHRVPWGNMYEFSSMIALVAVSAFLVLLARQPVRYLGAFVMVPVVLYLGLAGTVLYADPGPLVPALDSYWIKIHVVAAISSSGIFIVGAVTTALYLVKSRYEQRSATSPVAVGGGLARWLPSAEVLDRTAYRVIAFAFPIWTFAIIAGAIWAEAAWGRYWGWDPKETWSFITWVVYAGYLHARATAGWKGRRAAAVALVGFACLAFDYYCVNIWISGLHSYAGV